VSDAKPGLVPIPKCLTVKMLERLRDSLDEAIKERLGNTATGAEVFFAIKRLGRRPTESRKACAGRAGLWRCRTGNNALNASQTRARIGRQGESEN
jgi:hypothetical protein